MKGFDRDPMEDTALYCNDLFANRGEDVELIPKLTQKFDVPILGQGA